MKRLSHRLASRFRARLHRDERGFTLIETIIAITIIFASLVAAAYAVSAGFGYNALARERQAATGIANQVMEQVRALAWDRFTQGLADSDLTGDPDIKACLEGSATVYRYKTCTAPPSGSVQATGAKIVHTPGLTNQCTSGPACPLVPHRGTIAGSPLTYSWSAYLTNENPKTQPYVITVRVTWTGGRIAGAAKFIQIQTVAFNPKGCGGDDVHPFAGPCTYYNSADATVVPGRIDFGSNLTVGSNCPASAATCVSIVPQGADASVQSEQAASVQSSAAQGGVECAAGSPTPCATSKYGEVSISTSADSNPVTPVSAYGSVPSLTPTNGTFVVSPGTGTTLTVANGTGATASTVSATAPTSIATNPCPLASGLAVSQQTDALPCAASVSRPGATTTALLDMTGVAIASTNLGTAYMTQIATPPSGVNAASAFIDRKAAPPDAEDAMRATAARTFGTVSLFQLPSTMSTVYPAGWSSGSYLLTMTGYSDQASAAAGATTNAPTAAASTGSISYWNGSGFTSVNVTSLAAGATIPVQTVRNNTPWLQGTGLNRRWVCATITPSVSYGGPNTSSVGTPRTSAKASMASPIKGTVTYTVDIYNANPGTCTTPSGVPVSTPVNLTASIDLGTAQAVTTYKAAPRGV